MDERLKPRKLVTPEGRKVEVIRISAPQDHPKVKRFPLSHEYAKAFYVSASSGSINTSVPQVLGEFFVVDDGVKQRGLARVLVEKFAYNYSADTVLTKKVKNESR